MSGSEEYPNFGSFVWAVSKAVTALESALCFGKWKYEWVQELGRQVDEYMWSDGCYAAKQLGDGWQYSDVDEDGALFKSDTHRMRVKASQDPDTLHFTVYAIGTEPSADGWDTATDMEQFAAKVRELTKEAAK